MRKPFLRLFTAYRGAERTKKKIIKNNSSHKTVQPNLADKRDLNSFENYSEFFVVLSPDMIAA